MAPLQISQGEVWFPERNASLIGTRKRKRGSVLGRWVVRNVANALLLGLTQVSSASCVAHVLRAAQAGKGQRDAHDNSDAPFDAFQAAIGRVCRRDAWCADLFCRRPL